MAIAALAANAGAGLVALKTTKQADTNPAAVLAFLGLVALATGFVFFLSLLAAPSMVDDERLTPVHVAVLPLVFVAELKTLLLVLVETRYNVRYFPEVTLGDKVANSNLTLVGVFLVQVAVLALLAWSARRKPQ
ncbi:MAG: hypothetical protein KF857_03830 [Fimbriimonadaceae bacterium]|nr:hypothetical protein [Fimbriimonadaceae bacterium]